MIKFAFKRICFMKFAFDKCKFFLALSHPYFQAINCTGTDNQKQGNKTLHTP